jgi:hypothetical protein
MLHGGHHHLLHRHLLPADGFLGHDALNLCAEARDQALNEASPLVVCEPDGPGFRLPVPKSLVELLAGFIRALLELLKLVGNRLGSRP